MKEYKPRLIIINEFLEMNNLSINFKKVSTDIKITMTKLDSVKTFYLLKNIKNKSSKVIDIIKKEIYANSFEKILFTNLRLRLNNKFSIFKKINLYFDYLDRNDKNKLILIHFFKIKEIIKKYGYNKVIWHYNFYSGKHKLSYMQKKVTISYDDYFYIGKMKNMIKVYQKETKIDIDIKHPPLNDSKIIKYLDNYFSKMIIIRYDEKATKEFLHDYYIKEPQAEDNVREFIEDILFTYNKITNLIFDYKNSYQYNYGLKEEFHYGLVNNKNIVSSKIDETFLKKENYSKLIFMYEILKSRGEYSNRKKLINYISCIELLLLNNYKKKFVSKQFVYKVVLCLKRSCIKYDSETNEELKIIYRYRSKLIHGDYSGLTKEIKKISNLSHYKLSEKQINNEEYLTTYQMLEEILINRVEEFFFKIMKLFFEENNYINKLKNIIIND